MADPSVIVLCPDCPGKKMNKHRFIGKLPFPARVTGIVRRVDLVPHPSTGEDGLCGYMQCANCGGFVRFEFPPPTEAEAA